MDLNAPVRRYLPDFAVQDERVSREVAVWHLLTHTPGWEGQLNSEDRGAQTLAHFITTMKDLPQLANPGEVWRCNNAGLQRRGSRDRSHERADHPQRFRSLVFEPWGCAGRSRGSRISSPGRSRSRIAARPTRSASAGRSRDRCRSPRAAFR